MMSAPSALTWSMYIALTVPAVPTGMKAGVRTGPRPSVEHARARRAVGRLKREGEPRS